MMIGTKEGKKRNFINQLLGKEGLGQRTEPGGTHIQTDYVFYDSRIPTH